MHSDSTTRKAGGGLTSDDLGDPQSVMACKGGAMTNGTHLGLEPMSFQVAMAARPCPRRAEYLRRLSSTLWTKGRAAR
jgi:hypothetical protein